MVDTSQNIPSQLVPFVDRFRRITTPWWPFMKQLLDQLRVTISDVETVTTTVDNVKQQWGVEINENGQIRAAVRLDASETTSSFNVIADQFVVSTPADLEGTQAFVDGVIDGVPGVGLNSVFIVDGTIVARMIAVESLSAISANIGTVTAGLIQSNDGRMVIDLDNPSITMTT